MITRGKLDLLEILLLDQVCVFILFNLIFFNNIKSRTNRHERNSDNSTITFTCNEQQSYFCHFFLPGVRWCGTGLVRPVHAYLLNKNFLSIRFKLKRKS